MEELTTTMDSVSAENAQTENQPDNSARGSRDFSPEERAKIVAMAKELGVSKVSSEFGIKPRLISYWLHQDKKKASKPAKQKKAKASKRTPERVKESAVSEKVTENTPAVPTVPVETVKADKPLKVPERKAEKAVSAKIPERSEEKQPLVIENAILKERISALNAEIEKLRSALTSLM